DATGRKHPVDRQQRAPPGSKFRARPQRLLSDGDRPPADPGAPGIAADDQRLALRIPDVRSAIRIAGLASADPLSASRDGGVLNNGAVLATLVWDGCDGAVAGARRLCRLGGYVSAASAQSVNGGRAGDR